jgi:spore photoproduct lyase
MATKALSHFPNYHLSSELAHQNADYYQNKTRLHLKEKKGSILRLCASCSEEYICCGIHVISTLSNCPYRCSYCFLQNYLNDKACWVIADIPAILQEIRDFQKENPHQFLRLGNWELGDSLALEKHTHQAASLITELASFDHLVFDLRTKSHHVDSLLNLKHNRKTIISWTLNPEHICQTEEQGTSSLSQRLKAMQKCQAAGYLIGLHFDPMIFYDNWQVDYQSLVNHIFGFLKPKNIPWISIGSLRFNKEMKALIESNHPNSKLTCPEMLVGNDGKMRYFKPVRIQMYQTLLSYLQKHLPKSPFQPFIYLCMERADVWQKVFGYAPQSIPHLNKLIIEKLET